MTPLVTIGIPCFNAGQWVRAAIESALAQTHGAIEIIVSDDGSSDDSRAIVESFGSAVRTLFAEHRGANFARNQILGNARGTWIQYLDADDFLLPEKIARQLSETDEGDAADVLFSPTWIDENGTRRPSELDPQLDLYAQWLAWQLPQTGGCLWRKDALARIGGWNVAMPCCQEHELYLRALQAGLRFVFAPTPNAVYRIWSNATLCRRDPRLLVEVKTRLIDELRAWMNARGLWQETHRAIAGRACFEMARTLAKDDLAAATIYHRQRRAADLIALTGPAAPSAYRFTYRVAGFQNAERVASALSPARQRA